MVRARMPRAGDAFELLRELATGGILIVDRFADAGEAADDPNAEVAFRTLVQFDGDVCVSIHARALARSDFAAALASHQDHVRVAMLDRQARLRGVANRLIRRGRALGFVVGLGSGSWVGDLELLVVSVSTEVMAVAAASTGAVLFGAIAQVGVRAALDWRGLNRDRLRPAAAGDDR